MKNAQQSTGRYISEAIKQIFKMSNTYVIIIIFFLTFETNFLTVKNIFDYPLIVSSFQN